MRISVFEVEGWERERFECLADEHQIRFDARRLDRASAADHTDADVVSSRGTPGHATCWASPSSSR